MEKYHITSKSSALKSIICEIYLEYQKVKYLKLKNCPCECYTSILYYYILYYIILLLDRIDRTDGVVMVHR